jgi:hypothetical protein
MNRTTDAKLLEQYLKHKEYQKAYNKRDYVKAKRTEYNKDRWQRMKALAEIARDEQV